MTEVVVGAPNAGKTCPYCRFPLKGGVRAEACDVCATVHHLECWAEGGGCAVFGCTGKHTPPDAAVTAAPVVTQHAPEPRPPREPAPTAPVAPIPPVTRRRTGLVVAIAAVLVAAGTAAVLLLTLGGKHSAAPPAKAKTASGATQRPSFQSRVASRLSLRLVPLQRTLTSRVRSLAPTTASFAALESDALAVEQEVLRTQGWMTTSLNPASATDRAVESDLGTALDAHRVYAAYLANLPDTASISNAQAETAVGDAQRAEDAYDRLSGAAPRLPAMPLHRSDHLHLLAIATQPVTQPTSTVQPTVSGPGTVPTEAAGATYDFVADSAGEGVRYRYTPNHWCGYSAQGSPVPKTDPCWNDVVPGAGAAEGQRMTIYCYTTGATVRGDDEWAKVREAPDEYVPATYLLSGHNGRPAGAASC